MSTSAQIAANRANAEGSTGPRSDSGKSISSLNGVTFGLYSRRDFIRPDEEKEYAKLQADLEAELAPIGTLERTLAEEIRRASWRLQRCGHVEADLILRLNDNPYRITDPMEADSDNCRSIQNSVDRARAQANRLLHRNMSELRRLQAERQHRPAAQEAAQEAAPQAASKQPRLTLCTNGPANAVDEAPAAELGSLCKNENSPHPIARNAACPCGSGQKHKRCCGKDAPPLLHAA